MDTAWLTNFLELAPSDRDVVLVDDSEEENEEVSDNTCTGMHLSKPILHAASMVSAQAHAPSLPAVFCKSPFQQKLGAQAFL